MNVDYLLKGGDRVERQVITSTRLAKELLQNGFNIIDLAPNRTDSKRTVFVFESTEELKEYIKNRKEYKESAKTNQNSKPTKQNNKQCNMSY